MCLFRSKRRQDSFPRRRSTFRGSAKRPLAALRRMVDMSTLIVPTQGGSHRPTSDAGQAQGTASEPTRAWPVIKDSIFKHLESVYDKLRGRDNELSRRKFAGFLEGVQGETRLLPLEKETYNLRQFLEVWYMQYGWEAIRPLRPEEMDVTHPISNYFINSSHNTYLDGDQFFSDSRPDMYKRVLEENCRCIEIDVWNGETSGTRTPRNRSRSPHPDARRELSEHHRHVSTTSFITPSTAAEALERVEDTIHSVKDLITGRGMHHRTPNSSQPTLPLPEKESTTTLDVRDVDERPGRSRESSKLSKFTCPKNEPRVLHGWTGTKPTGFREVCKAVRESAFVTSPLPIIVSLEVHADLEQQEVMVDIMKEEWGDFLLERPHEGCDPKHRQPRLEELLNKILIKVKRHPQKINVPAEGGSPALLTPFPTHEDDASGSDDERAPHKTKKVPICESLSALAIYTHSEHFRSFEVAAARSPSHIFSISESRILELHQTKYRELFQHNRDYFMRAFPAGWRVGSSNLEPSLYWRRGVQMVAMNWQSCDEGMMLNHAMFTGSQGWVLKPAGYRSNTAASSTTNDDDVVPHRTIQLLITVLAGQDIPHPAARQEQGVGVGTGGDKSFHPVVIVKVDVEREEERPGDEAVKGGSGGGGSREDHFRLKTKSAQTVNPDFSKNGMTLTFPEMCKVVEELSFVTFKIEDSSSYFHGQLAAWACIRMDRLRQGYRFVSLRDYRGKPSEGKLLIHVNKVVR